MSERYSVPNKLKSLVAIGLATSALNLCAPAAHAEVPNLQADLDQALSDMQSQNPGLEVDVAVFDSTTSKLVHSEIHRKGNDGPAAFYTASIIKLSILEEVLRQDQAAGHPITNWEMSQAVPMITQSDNAAATNLWQHVGGAGSISDLYRQSGAPGTSFNGSWGLTATSAIDQVQIVNNVAYPGRLLTTESAAVADQLMDRVTPGQHWGVSGGVPADVSVDLKNGWLPNTNVSINSVGHVRGEGEDYTIAVLTHGSSSMNNAIGSIEKLSTIAWNDIKNS